MIFLFAYLFYLGFVLSISAYRRWIAGELNAYNKVMLLIPVVLFACLDIVLNYSVFLITMGFPPDHCYTISARLAYYRERMGVEPWKKKVADFVCEKLLNPIDPSGSHC